MVRKIHFVVEGEVTEPSIIKNMLLKLNFTEKVIPKKLNHYSKFNNVDLNLEITVEKTKYSQITALLLDIKKSFPDFDIDMNKYFNVKQSDFYFIFDVDSITEERLKLCQEFLNLTDDGYLLLSSPCFESIVEKRSIDKRVYDGMPKGYKKVCNLDIDGGLTNYINDNIFTLLIDSINVNKKYLEHYNPKKNYNDIYDHPSELYKLLDFKKTHHYNILFSTLYVAVADIFNLKADGSNNYVDTLVNKLKTYI